jgi:hypothetical protein
MEMQVLTSFSIFRRKRITSSFRVNPAQLVVRFSITKYIAIVNSEYNLDQQF